MRRYLALLVLSASALGCTTSAEPSQDPPEPPPAPLACAQELLGAIYCQPTEAGKPIGGVSIQGIGGVTVRLADGSLQSFDVRGRVLRPRAADPVITPMFAGVGSRDVLFLGDHYCYPAAGGYRCAPLAGGATTPWIAGASRVERLGLDRFAAIVAGEGGRFDVVVADAAGRAGMPLGQASGGSWLGTVGDDTIVYQSVGPPSLHAVAAAGGTPRDLGIGFLESSYVAVRGRSVVEYHGEQPGIRVDVDTLARENLPALPPANILVRAGATTLLLDYRSIRALGADGRPAETLYELPPASTSPGPSLGSWAVTDEALYALVVDEPCLQGQYGTRGGGPGYRICDDRPGFWAIVRVPLPAP